MIDFTGREVALSGVVNTFVDILVFGGLGFLGVAAFSLRNTAPPKTPPFARPRSTSSDSGLRGDNNAVFLTDRGFLFRKRWFFTATGCPPVRLRREEVDRIQASQWQEPVQVTTFRPRTWWMFEGNFYWEAAGYTARDVLALVRDRERRRRTRLERAHTALNIEQQPRKRRQHIPKEVRRLVFERDGGRCAECGTNFDLQYDHILPVARGGATSLENLQLLCGDCNRAKGATL
ncbi:HNH endonuclease [Amycolatopsis cynarae]|uniref:HNH endonuclease n=1 Tax=Amycolatopsis cynarae TaxID=2995223 RepID=A0ABY7B2V8_9PSEU|nr:HNH endonuclease [Amycolatopsis sp. HUAS 11-8]WAL66641.1 HNH endonuclease [Amycolatopsis sp. HUAS 11-8]